MVRDSSVCDGEYAPTSVSILFELDKVVAMHRFCRAAYCKDLRQGDRHLRSSANSPDVTAAGCNSRAFIWRSGKEIQVWAWGSVEGKLAESDKSLDISRPIGSPGRIRTSDQ